MLTPEGGSSWIGGNFSEPGPPAPPTFTCYIDARRDGVKEAVRGRGQIDVAGPANQGRRAFE